MAGNGSTNGNGAPRVNGRAYPIEDHTYDVVVVGAGGAGLRAVVGRNHAAAVQILGAPIVTVVMLLFVFNMTYHMWLGMQVIVEDYVHHDLAKLLLLMGNTFFCVVVGFTCAFALMKLSFGV